ncbi:60S ribosomal protein L9-1 [Forsythia ovata]|uniref:60S ribosomal protein L9-1 n=2 Tax=Forsythia ovata TaxID=205694 RepID=A0ABD1WJ93_9LAMI
MKTILSSETMDLPDGVKIKVKAKMIEVEGPRGKLTRDFKHLNLDFQLITDEETGKRKLKVDAWFGSRKTTAAIRTALSHVGNLINGVTKGYRYKMRFVYAHFPINASITNGNKSIEIRNFLGEKKVRKVDMLDGVTILRSEKVKDELVLDGNDIELVSRSTALINQGFTLCSTRSSTGTHSTRTKRESKSRREKMKTILSSETMDLPDGVKIKVKAKMIEVEGPRGKLTRDFKHLNLDFQLITDEETGKRKLKVDAWFGSRKTTAAIRTALSHVGNLINGVTKGYRYKMRFVYAHFPINASITNGNKSIEIRNFLGEKKVRKVDMLDGVTILRSEKVKDELVLDGNDIELVSRSTALINQKCHVKNKDIRKFLDGIYVSEKGTIVEEE